MQKIKAVAIGDIGEKYAAEYMKKCGYQIIDTNYSSKFGEIDIIAKKEEYIVFCEVKARRSVAFGNPAEFVDWRKRQKIIKTAYKYAEENNVEGAVRFDVCEVFHKETGKGEIRLESINYIEGAFEAE